MPVYVRKFRFPDQAVKKIRCVFALFNKVREEPFLAFGSVYDFMKSIWEIQIEFCLIVMPNYFNTFFVLFVSVKSLWLICLIDDSCRWLASELIYSDRELTAKESKKFFDNIQVGSFQLIIGLRI